MSSYWFTTFHHPFESGLRRRDRRRGAIAVLAAVMMLMVLGMVAFAVDLGYLAMARTETQRTADATAHAAVIEFAQSGDAFAAADRAREVATSYSAANPVLGSVTTVTDGVDVQLGHYVFGSGNADLDTSDPAAFNAVKVRIRRTDEQNGAVTLFFGSILGKQEQNIQAEAIAALVRNVKGFRTPPSGVNLPMLPIVIAEEYWHEAIAEGEGSDQYSYDKGSDAVDMVPDGIAEITLFPNKTGSSGNLGTVNIGVTNNSTSYISNQIQYGLSKSDLDFHGGSIELNDQGQLFLGGNPGLSASMQKALKRIIGEVRVIPIYRSVSGNGNNANYEIIKFVAVRIMAAKLSGGSKAITVQPASMTLDGLIQGRTQGSSEGIYSSPRIVH